MDFKVVISPELAAATMLGVPDKVIRRALNRTGRGARRELSRLIRQEYNIKQKTLYKYIKFYPAKKGEHVAALRISARRIGLYHFVAPSSVRQWKQNPAGWVRRGNKYVRRPYVKVKVKKTSGWRLLRHAFIAKMDSGHVGVFERKRGWKHKRHPVKHRYHGLPIKELTAPSPVEMMEKVHGLKKLDDYIMDRLKKELQHEIHYYYSVGW